MLPNLAASFLNTNIRSSPHSYKQAYLMLKDACYVSERRLTAKINLVSKNLQSPF